MSLENLTPKQFEALKRGKAVGEIRKLHRQIKTVGGKKVLPEKYCEAWPLIREALTIAKIFTPDKVDKIIDLIIAAGDNTCKP